MNPAMPSDCTVPANGAPDPRPGAPDLIGRYRVLEQIDRPGTGPVFVAERADGLFDHRVAIKRMSATLAPVAARSLFERERQALARLSHRNIAQLFDGGVDADGRPYLVMELVEGLELDRYAFSKRLSLREIAALVAAVCDGVQHAHQHLIVHTDLSCANILVGEDGIPRIVDFGVARVLRKAEAELEAAVPRMSVYASPQQIAGAPPNVHDDVYAIGKILREMLKGASRRPHDLEDIAARACASAPMERYPTVQELADDLRAWRDHRPLATKRGKKVYFVRKFLRRHRVAAISFGAALAGLAGALALSTSLYLEADRDRARAEARFSDVRDLSRYLLFDVYDRLEKTPHALAMRHDVAEIAQGYLAQLASTSSAPAAVKRELVDGLVRLAALQAGRARSNLGRPAAAKANLDRADTLLASMGSATIADKHRQIQINLLRAAIAMHADQAIEAGAGYLKLAQDELAVLDDHGARVSLAVEAAMAAADLASWQGDYDAALARASMTLSLIETLGPPLKDSDDFRDIEMRARSAKGDAFYYLGRNADAEGAYKENVDRAVAWLAEQPGGMLARRHAIVARWNLGTTIVDHDPAGALKQLDQAILLLPDLLEFEPADENALRTESVVHLSRAEVLAANGRFDEGLAAVQTQAARRRARYEANPDTPEYARSYAVFLTAKGDLLADNKRGAEACADYEAARSIFADLQARDRISGFDASSGGLAQLQEAIAKSCPNSVEGSRLP